MRCEQCAHVFNLADADEIVDMYIQPSAVYNGEKCNAKRYMIMRKKVSKRFCLKLMSQTRESFGKSLELDRNRNCSIAIIRKRKRSTSVIPKMYKQIIMQIRIRMTTLCDVSLSRLISYHVNWWFEVPIN